MKNISKMILLFTLVCVLALPVNVFAEPSDQLKGIFDALLSTDSNYSETKAMYMEYFPETKYEETLTDNGFTLTISNNEYMSGSWDFIQDGDDLTITVSQGDFSGAMQVMYVINAVGIYYDMDPSVLNGYINGLSILGIENEYFRMTTDDTAETTSYEIYIAGPYDMKELDQMVLDENVMYFGTLDEDYTSRAASIGKIMSVTNGSKDDATILLGEYGGLDALAYQSLLNLVRIMQPRGWESFLSDYTALEDAETAEYSVSLNVDEARVGEIIDDLNPNYSYAIIHFGA